MFSKYQNPNIMKKMLPQKKILAEYMRSLINECIDAIDFLSNLMSDNLPASENKLVKNPNSIGPDYGYSKQIFRNLIVKIADKIDKIFDTFIFFFTRFMDVFFLRRFLDKTYITHAITYTGAYHSCIYIDILAKEFGFKITHAAYSKYHDLDTLNAEVKKTDVENMGFIFYQPVRNQCSDLDGFPENFS